MFLGVTDWPAFGLEAAAVFLTLLGAGGAFVKYRNEQTRERRADRASREKDTQARRDDLSWRKTQFLFELAQDFASDDRHQHAYQLIDSNAPVLKKSLGAGKLTVSQRQARYDIDRYLDFFDRLSSFVNVTGSLTLEDINCFSGYFEGIANNKHVKGYAEANGYQDVLDMNDRFPS